MSTNFRQGISIFLGQQHRVFFEYLAQQPFPNAELPRDHNVIENFFEYLPQIIHEAGQTVLAFASLLFSGAVLIIVVFFRHDSVKVRLSVFFAALLFSLGLFGVAVIQKTPTVLEETQRSPAHWYTFTTISALTAVLIN